MNEFSAGSCIRFGWETFKKRPWFLIFAALILGLLEGGSRFEYQTNSTLHFTPALIIFFIIAGIIGAVIAVLARMGRVKLSLKAHDAIEHAGWRDAWAPHPFWRYIGGGVLVGLIVLAGFILLIIPGIIWSVRYMFVPYIIMDRRYMPLEAIRESSRITYGHKWPLFELAVLLLLLNILGFICLIVGLLVTVPISWLAVTHAYRTLSEKAGPIPTV